MVNTSYRIASRHRALLGEGPLWDHRHKRLLWCDILQRKLLVLDETGERELMFPGGITAFGLAAGGGYIATSERRFLLLDSDLSAVWTSPEIEHDKPENRFNDGKVDPLGRFWAGTMQHECKGREGSFYRLDGSRQTVLASGFGCTNGPAFSPDGDRVYYVDSNERMIYCADARADLPLGAGTAFARFSEDEGSPDGMTVDSDGRLYVGHFGGGRISRFLSDGSRDAQFPLPARNITSVTFGGPEFATLYATSANCTLNPEELSLHPLDGATFALDVGARGLPQPEFQPAVEQKA